MRTLLGERHIEQDGLLAYLTLEVVPPVILFGIGQVVCLYVEVCSQKSGVGRLAYVLLQLELGDALLFGDCVVGFDIDSLQEILVAR